MNRFLLGAILVGSLIPSWGLAQDFQAGLVAATAGDFVTAFREWTPPGEQSDANAQFYLGLLYDNGQIYIDNLGLPQDHIEAAKRYRLAATQGHADAQRNLGMLYESGKGVVQDFVVAHMWLDLGAMNGSALASQFRDDLAAKMSPADVVEAEMRAQACVASGYQDCA